MGCWVVRWSDTELEVFPLEPRSARAALAKAKERRALKARLAKEGPTEDAIAAVQVLPPRPSPFLPISPTPPRGALSSNRVHLSPL